MEHVAPALIVPQRHVGCTCIEDQRAGRRRPVREPQEILAIRKDHHQPDSVGEQRIQRRVSLFRGHGHRRRLVGMAQETAGRAVVLVRQRGAGKSQVVGPQVITADREHALVIDPQDRRLHVDRGSRSRREQHAGTCQKHGG